MRIPGDVLTGASHMVFFIDESGHPHPNDSSPLSVLGAVGLPMHMSRQLMANLYRLKRDILAVGDPASVEGKYKAHALLNERTQRRVPAKWQYVESVVDLAVNLPVVSFFMIVERPTQVVRFSPDCLPRYAQFLLERMNQYMVNCCPATIAPMVFDSRSSGPDSLWSASIGNFLFRHQRGRLWRNLLETPFFVDSAITPGVQIADYFVSIVRQYWEVTKYNRPAPAMYRAAIERLYRRVRGTVRDLDVPDTREGAPQTLFGEYHINPRVLVVDSAEDVEGSG